jgi:molybdate transport system permease protein
MTAGGATARFYIALSLLGGVYIFLIVAMLVADFAFAANADEPFVWKTLRSPDVQYAIRLSLASCFVSTILCLWVGVPLGYLLSRTRFWGRSVVDAIVDIPIVLPPLVIGISLLILFRTAPGEAIQGLTQRRMGLLLTYLVLPTVIAIASWFFLRRLPRRRDSLLYLVSIVMMAVVILRISGLGTFLEERLQSRFGTRITFEIPSIIVAQFAVSCAFAVRTMRVTFDQISPRTEQVALTLGCTRSQAFWSVTIPEAWRGIVSAGTIAWARSLGEFGPILIFAGATRMRTEVLSTTVWLEFSVGDLNPALAVSLLMVVVALVVLLLMRTFGLRSGPV